MGIFKYIFGEKIQRFQELFKKPLSSHTFPKAKPSFSAPSSKKFAHITLKVFLNIQKHT